MLAANSLSDRGIEPFELIIIPIKSVYGSIIYNIYFKTYICVGLLFFFLGGGGENPQVLKSLHNRFWAFARMNTKSAPAGKQQ